MPDEAQILRGGLRPVEVFQMPRLRPTMPKPAPSSSRFEGPAPGTPAGPPVQVPPAHPTEPSAHELRGLEEALRKKADEQLKQAIAAVQQKVQQEQAQMLKKLEQQRQALARLTDRFPAALARCLRDAEDEMLALVFAAVSRVLGEHALTREGLRAMLAECLQEWPEQQSLSLHLHPDDLALLQPEGLPDQAPSDPSGRHHGRHWRWVADPHVAVGGWVLQTADQTLDARLDVQLAAFKDQLLQIRASRRCREHAAGADHGG